MPGLTCLQLHPGRFFYLFGEDVAKDILSFSLPCRDFNQIDTLLL